MSQMNIHPDSGRFPSIRKGGKYGPGCPNTATCRVVGLRREVNSENAPPYDPTLERGPYIQFTFQVIEPDQTVFHDEWQRTGANSGSKALRWIKALGAPVDEDGNFDDENVLAKECILEFKEPAHARKDTAGAGPKYTKVLGVFGLEA